MIDEQIITIDAKELAKRPYSSIARVVVKNQDGKDAVFWLSARLNNQNRPVCEISALPNNPDTNTPRKSLTGWWTKLTR